LGIIGALAHIGETIDQRWPGDGGPSGSAPVPGLVLVSSRGEPVFGVRALGSEEVTLGRGELAGVALEDPCLSRKHASVARVGSEWVVRDVGSRNGSALGGVIFQGERRFQGDAVLRVGDTLLLLRDDVRAYVGTSVEQQGGATVGPRLAAAWSRIADAAASGETLHVTGESGSGKELAARHFHAAGPRSAGPFVAVNCATITSALAERLLFGAKKGAFSGADADAEGYLQAADQGTLFLDEVAELDAEVQAKLLRVVETREVMPLGASRARKVSVGIVSATHGSLRAEVERGRFRQDLFFRLGRPEVALPPVRERLEEIPWLIQAALASQGSLRAHASLVEACLLRAWPGNVRELIVEVGEAARSAAQRGATHVESVDLDPAAGRAAESRGVGPVTPGRRARPTTSPPREVLVEALAASGGNITQAARALGVHRTQLKRWLDRHRIEPGPV
jgi:DNA-binding NtrC family response regulator